MGLLHGLLPYAASTRRAIGGCRNISRSPLGVLFSVWIGILITYCSRPAARILRSPPSTSPFLWILARGWLFESAYGQAYVFSAFIKDVDKRPDPTVWGSRLPFNTLCAEFRSPSGGWVHSVAFSPNGDALAFVSHDSSVSIAYPQGPEAPPTPLITVRTPLLPFVSLVWINENEIVAAGHDCQPVTFQGSEQGWYSHPLPYSHCLIPNLAARECRLIWVGNSAEV